MLPKRFEILARALDDVITRPPRRRRLAHPVIVIIDNDDLGRASVAEYGKRLRRTHVVHTLVEEEKADLTDLLGTLKNGLSLGTAMGRRRKGFPRFETCRAALTAPDRTDRGELLDHLYAELTRRHRFLKTASAVGGGQGALRFLMSLVLHESMLRWLYGEWTRWTRSLKWVSAGTGLDYLTYISTREPDDLTELGKRILVGAFLRDLKRQLRSSVYSVGRIRRRWHFVVLFPGVRKDGPAWEFIEECTEALAQPAMKKSPIVVLAACDDGAPEPEDFAESIDAGDDAFDEAADAIQATPGPRIRPLLRVPVPPADEDNRGGRWLRRNPPRNRRNRWTDRVVPTFNMLATAVVLGAAVWVPLHWGDLLSHGDGGPCGDTWVLRNGERVGITDGNCPLSSGVPDLAAIEHLIAVQNREVEGVRHPYRTVVFLSPLTVPTPINGRPGTDSVDELRGVALAQQKKFEDARHDSNVVPIKVLIANTGDRLAAAPAVARHVVDRAKSDHTLEAIIGISQSRRESHQAIQELSSLKLPIIASNTTSDEILDSSPLYYEIAPQNRREAETTAQFLAHQKIAAAPDGKQVLASKAVVVEDPRDEFSQNLAHDFRGSFTAPGNQILTTYDYGPTENGPPGHDPDGIDDTPEPSADQLVQDLCNTIGNTPAIVYYASRSQDLPAALDKINQTPECGGRQFAFVSNDENARFIADGTIDVSHYTNVHFYDAAFSDLNNHPTPVSQEFAGRYQRQFHKLVSDSGAGGADDAFTAASKAIDLAYQQDPSIPPGVVASTLHDGKVSFPGVTGFITFNGEHDTTRIPPDKLIFVVEEQPQGPRTLLACGRQSNGSELTTWGGHFPCPRD